MSKAKKNKAANQARRHRQKLFKAMDAFANDLDNFVDEVPSSPLDQRTINTLLAAAVAYTVSNSHDQEEAEALTIDFKASEIIAILMELYRYRKQFGLLPDNPGKPLTDAIQ